MNTDSTDWYHLPKLIVLTLSLRKCRMIGQLFKTLRERRLRKAFHKGAELSRFVAKDVRREIRVLDDSHIDEGYVTALVRTINLLYLSGNLESNTEFGTPEILHLNQAWNWGGKSWGGKEPSRPRIPLLTPEELKLALRQEFPNAEVNWETINSEYQSWSMTVKQNSRAIELVWGPLSGFGAIDRAIKNDNLFDYCDEYLYSVDEAISFAQARFSS